MRITDSAMRMQSLANLQSTASRLAGLQSQLSSGQQITKPSDDPSGTVRALQLRAEVQRSTQYAANASDALGWLSTADTSFSQAVDLMQTARTLVVQGLSTGSTDAAGASAIADQIDGLRSALLGVANTVYNGRPIFGGTTAGGAAYDSAGNYVGDAGTVSRTVGPNAGVQLNANGPGVFGPPGNDVFALLSNISATLRTNPGALGPQLTALDTALDGVSSAQAQAGAVYKRVQTAQTVQSGNLTALKTALSDVQDIDLADMAVKVSSANVTYQAALQTTANISQLSLLNFLK